MQDLAFFFLDSQHDILNTCNFGEDDGTDFRSGIGVMVTLP